ncbi:MAG: hypothetical protein K6A43_13265 [Treponema sp.]|nr:hypothetical protein [Treponema sp.]
MIKKIVSSILSAAFFAAALSAVELVPTTELLAAYLERDRELQSAAIDYEKSLLSYQSAQIENGFDITLSTGRMVFRKNDDGSSFTVSPSVKASVPQAANLGIQLSGDVSITEAKTSADDISLGLSLDIISSSALKRQISLLKAERSVLEAKRKVESTALSKEKEFYQSLKSLITQISTIISKEKDLYSDKISFEKIKAQGYSKTSSSYRRAELTVTTDEHDIEKLVHTLKNDYKIFYIKCGQRLELDDELDFMSLVPSDIPEVEAANIHSFNPNAYTKTESAVWTNKINSMTRESNKNFTLAATGGFTYNNSSTNSNTVNVGLASTIGGVTVSPTVSFPVGTDSFSPSVSLEASVSPNTFKKNSITKKTYELEEEQEKMNIRNAKIAFADEITAQELELSSILWERTSNEENLSMYQSLETDLAQWYEQGIVTQSEYLSAKVNRQKCSVTKITNLIEMILFNDEVNSLFVSDLKNEPFVRPERGDKIEN